MQEASSKTATDIRHDSGTTWRNPSKLDGQTTLVRMLDAKSIVGVSKTASEYFKTWASVPAPARGKTMSNLARIVENNKEALASLICEEIGKTIRESRGEVQEIIDTCEFFASEGRRLYGHTVPSELENKQLMTHRVPLGACFVITASNFPAAVPSWYFVPALVAGNTVVWKASETAPRVAMALCDMVWAAGVPREALQMILADGRETESGLQMALREGFVQKIGFTGSSEVGLKISALAGQYMQRPLLELGGKNPMVITSSADLDLALDGALFSGWGTAGQRCTSLGSIIIDKRVAKDFKSRLVSKLEKAQIGDPREDVLYGPLINMTGGMRFDDSLSMIEAHHIVSGGVGRITDQNPRQHFVGDWNDGVYYHPTLVSGVKRGDKIANTETFGPLVCMIEYETLEEAIEISNAHGYGLSAAIYTNDPREAWSFVRGNEAGMISICNTTSGAEAHLPFGGNGKSGNGGRQSGVWAVDEFTRWQSVNWDWAGKLQRAQMDNDNLTPDLAFTL